MGGPGGGGGGGGGIKRLEPSIVSYPIFRGGLRFVYFKSQCLFMKFKPRKFGNVHNNMWYVYVWEQAS